MFKKITFFLFLGFFIMNTYDNYAQNLVEGGNKSIKPSNITGLSIYPNPTSGDKLYIVTKSNFTKQVAIFNVLGKEIISATLHGKELNIAKLKPSVYIIKITENGVSATRKLIVK